MGRFHRLYRWSRYPRRGALHRWRCLRLGGGADSVLKFVAVLMGAGGVRRAMSRTMRPTLVSHGMAIIGTPLGYRTSCFPKVTEGMETDVPWLGKSFFALPAIILVISPRASTTSSSISVSFNWQRAEAASSRAMALERLMTTQPVVMPVSRYSNGDVVKRTEIGLDEGFPQMQGQPEHRLGDVLDRCQKRIDIAYVHLEPSHAVLWVVPTVPVP